MTELFVLTPSRGRPENIKRLSKAFVDQAKSHLVVIIDKDDICFNEYMSITPDDCSVIMAPGGEPGIVRPLNWGLKWLMNAHNPSFIGFMGDDHLPKTPNWDGVIIETLRQLETGIVYGNDLIQGADLPTAAFMTSNIASTLGYMAPPELRHLYVDNYWKELGEGLDRLVYLKDVIIEHIHPNTNPDILWDKTYELANKPNVDRDNQSYSRFVADGKLARDVKLLRRVL